MARVLLPLPDCDFDVTEVSVPWRVLSDAGHDVVFATERGGAAPAADPRLLDGVLFGKLGAEPEPKAFYRELERDRAFRSPAAWAEVTIDDYDGLLLPGGHAPGMRQYLESESLQSLVAGFWAGSTPTSHPPARPVAAICHGVVVLARSRDPATGRSVLAGRRTTCLPKFMERSAYFATAWKLGRYYRTYPAYVADEVAAAAGEYERGPLGLTRGTATDDAPAFVVQDGNYLSARWPGDAYLFARRFATMLRA